MRELQILDRELLGSKVAIAYRKDINLFQRSLVAEATPVLRQAEAEAKRKRVGQVTVLVVVHD